jgi:hypothetical protein
MTDKEVYLLKNMAGGQALLPYNSSYQEILILIILAKPVRPP